MSYVLDLETAYDRSRHHFDLRGRRQHSHACDFLAYQEPSPSSGLTVRNVVVRRGGDQLGDDGGLLVSALAANRSRRDVGLIAGAVRLQLATDETAGEGISFKVLDRHRHEDLAYLFEETGAGVAGLINTSAWLGNQLCKSHPALVSRGDPLPEPAR